MFDTPTVKVEAYLGRRPEPEFHEALAVAQRAAKSAVRDVDMVSKGKKRGSYKSTEFWIRDYKGVILDAGLVAQQLGGFALALGQNDRSGMLFVVKRVTFSLVHRASGTGMIYSYDFPLYGDPSGNSPSKISGGAYTSTWKYFLRGALAIPRCDPGDDFEDREQGHEQGPCKAELAARESARESGGQPSSVGDEPLVKHARAEFGAEDISGPNTTQPTRSAPADGMRDPSERELLAAGWQGGFAAELSAFPADEAVSEGIRDFLLNSVNTYAATRFGGDLTPVGALWEGTGYTPQGAGGPLPTGVQARRFASKFQWNKNNAANAAGA